MSTNCAVAWFGKYTLTGEVIRQSEGTVTLAVQTVSQNGERLPDHHLIGSERSFGAADVLLSD